VDISYPKEQRYTGILIPFFFVMKKKLENDFFGFPKAKWLHLTGEVDKSVRLACQIFSGFKVPKITKIG